MEGQRLAAATTRLAPDSATDLCGPNLRVSEDGRCVRQLAETNQFDGAWCLARPGVAPPARVRCTFTIRRRTYGRWMAVGFAQRNIRLFKPMNRDNIFVYASSGSLKARPPRTRFSAARTTTSTTARAPVFHPILRCFATSRDSSSRRRAHARVPSARAAALPPQKTPSPPRPPRPRSFFPRRNDARAPLPAFSARPRRTCTRPRRRRAARCP